MTVNGYTKKMRNWHKIAVLAACLVLGGVIGFYIGKPKKVYDINVEATLDRLKSDSIVLKKQYDRLYLELIQYQGMDSVSRVEEKQTNKDYDSIRRNFITDADKLYMRRAIIERGKKRFD